MGSLHAMVYANSVKDGSMDLDTALLIQLQSNHYPPIHSVFIPVAKRAIELANDGNWSQIIDMPNGRSLSVSSIIEQLHLDNFLDCEE
jgi:hypothetical protein